MQVLFVIADSVFVDGLKKANHKPLILLSLRKSVNDILNDRKYILERIL